MDSIINYVTFVFDKLVVILDSIKLPGSISLLRYLLSAIIIISIFKIIKLGYSEVESNVNHLNASKFAIYGNSNKLRKEQIIKDRSFANGIVAGTSLSRGDYDTARNFIDRS